MSQSDDDVPTLPADTLAALQSFYDQQADENQKLVTALQTGEPANIELKEDWQLSQFWYTEETANRIAEEALSVAGDTGRIACISAPTAYKKIIQIKPASCDVKCLEYDTRFEMFGEDFLYYDYKEPLNLPLELKHQFDVVIADPPFLSEECLCKTSLTSKFLTKNRIILCTGAIMEETALKLLNAKPCKFLPQHSNHLQNEFRCYTNYNSELLNKI